MADKDIPKRVSVATWLAGLAAVTVAFVGWLLQNEFCQIGGTIATIGVAAIVIRRQHGRFLFRYEQPEGTPLPPRVQPVPAEPGDEHSLVENMMNQGRYALLLRPQIASELTDDQFKLAVEQFEDSMALVPSGRVA